MNDWQLPPDYVQEYRDACLLAATDDEAFKNFRKNDRIATIIENTTKEWADQALDKMGYTPTMIRYWYINDLMKNIYGCTIKYDIVEIGAGYGGLCRVLMEEYNGREYTIFDLPEVVALQKRYLSKYAIEPVYHHVPVESEADLLISWCAWSELSHDLRVEYAEKVISKCNHFFICSNYNKAEDLEILSKYFTGIKEYDDDLVQNVIYV